jgi:hypothetical protein
MSYGGSAAASVYLENGFMQSISPGQEIPFSVAFDVPASIDPTAIQVDDDLLDGGGTLMPLR